MCGAYRYAGIPVSEADADVGTKKSLFFVYLLTLGLRAQIFRSFLEGKSHMVVISLFFLENYYTFLELIDHLHNYYLPLCKKAVFLLCLH